VLIGVPERDSPSRFPSIRGFFGVLARSDGAGELGEGRCEPMPLVDIHAEFVVVVMEVLDERVPGIDHPRRAQPFQTAHRP
jgi:hypothetical protein